MVISPEELFYVKIGPFPIMCDLELLGGETGVTHNYELLHKLLINCTIKYNVTVHTFQFIAIFDLSPICVTLTFKRGRKVYT